MQKHVQAVRGELAFLTSLLTSPLPKHAKASTLWAQRLWLLCNFLNEVDAPEDGHGGSVDKALSLWYRELETVMKAGERHPRNYYAWEYARQLYWLFDAASARHALLWDRQQLTVQALGVIRAWCLMHPRDISGWGYLVFLLERGREFTRRNTVDSAKMVEREIERVMRETGEFVKKYKWKGESIEWFLKAAKRFI